MVALILVVLGIWGVGQACVGVVYIALGMVGLLANAVRRDEVDR
ncbi:MAG TPA: hypothetical protein VMJ10_06190 [Kofleriaceae bacterium]|nr:hypothetical protein [Kofleriaceae bacterium]